MEEVEEKETIKFEEKNEEENSDNQETNRSNINNQKLITLLNLMSIELPLNTFAEKIESETGGKFTFKDFYKIINEYYKKLTKKEKKDLIKYISLSAINVNNEKPYISLFSIFNYFINLLNQKIYSPSLILYEISIKLKNVFKKSTLEFFISNKYQASGEINLEELINLFYKQLDLNELTSAIFFNMINYKKKNAIKIEEIILIIDSYRDDNNDDIFNEKDKNILFLNEIIEKNFVNIDKVFKETEGEYISFDTFKKTIMKEIKKNYKYNKFKDIIDENMFDNILSSLSEDEKIYKKEFKNNYLEAKSKLKNKKVELNITQKYWINKYIDILPLIGMKPYMEFKLISDKNKSNQIEIDELKNQLLNDIVKLKINRNDIENIIKSFDVNYNGTINYLQYEECINQVLKEKEEIMKLELESINYLKNEEDNNITNMWESGIRPYNFYLLPVKGNTVALEKINRNIKDMISNFNSNQKKEIKIIRPLDNYKTIGTISSDLTTFKRGLSVMNNEDFNDEYYLKSALDNFNFNKNSFPCFDLINHLVEKEDFSNKYAWEIIKYLDEDNDGYINIIDLIKFLLHELKYKATKLVYKYLYIKIYKELKLSSCEEFFKNYNIKLTEIIDVQKLCKFFLDLNIEFPLTKQILDEVKFYNKPPLIYEYLSDLIDGYQNDQYINNLIYEKKNATTKNYNCKNFEQELKRKVNYLEYKENNKGNSKENNFEIKLNKILENCDEIMNYSNYKKNFSAPLRLDEFFSLILFQLLKTFSKNGEQQISKTDLLMFFESYSLENNKININKITKSRKKDIKEIIKKVEQVGAPINYAIEILPFRSNGIIPSSELIKYLSIFYNESISKNDLMNIVFFIDERKIGVVNYEQIQLFLNKYCKIYSIKLELQIIACNICKENYFDPEKYFNNKYKDEIENNNIINKNKHNLLLKNICSNDINKDYLFDYLSKNANNYNFENLLNLLKGYFELDMNYEDNKNFQNKEDNNLEDELPSKNIVEQILKNIELGEKGIFSINEFIMKFKRNYRKKLLEKIDKEKKGFITFPEFIKNCHEIYGTNIDLNYKLCAQYLFKKYINNPNKIQKFLLDKTKSKNIYSYFTYEKTYNYFMFAFCNNKFLFESFYLIYKEKRGKHINNICLKSIEQFILINNKINNEMYIKGNSPIKSIKEILHKRMITIKDIINHINVAQSGLEKNFLIKESYLRTMLQTKLNFIEQYINIICTQFKAEEDKFDLKKFFLYDNQDIKKYNIILYDEILPKIKSKIKRSEYTSYKEYKSKIFNNIDYLDICELFSKFNNLYSITLYNCLLLMKDEQYFSTEKFFNDNNLKNEFLCKNYDPTLKLALTRLNEFFQKNQDKIKIFKQFDLDKNGKLSSEEFIIALNSFGDLNLNDNQKYKILNLIDVNKDGKIDIQEFIKFINNIKNNINEKGELTASVPFIRKKVNLKESNIENLENENVVDNKSIVKSNINYNKNMLKHGNNDFLNYIIILQESLFKNDNESLEKEFYTEDPMSRGFISVNKFKNILKKKLLNIKGGNMDKFISLANKGLKENVNKENENDTKFIHYHNFLQNLCEFRYDIKGNNSEYQNSKINLPKIN